MSKKQPLSVQLEPEIEEHVAAVARALHRPRAWVIEQAVKDYVSVQEWQLAAIDEGVRAADAGRVVAHEDVAAWVHSWDSSEELPMPKCK